MKLKGLKVGIDVGLPILLAAVCVAASAYFAVVYVPRQREATIERWRGELESRADGRKAAIELWVANGLADAQGIASFPSLFRLLSHGGAPTTNASADRAHVDEILTRLAPAGGRLGTYVVDGTLRIVARSDGRLREIEPGCLAAARAVLASGTASSDFHQHGNGHVVVTFAVPVREASGNAPVGVVVVAEDPSVWLYPYVGIGPAATSSAETLLVKRDGDDALFLSPLRHNPAPPLTLRRPLSLPGFAAQEALGGRERSGAYRDYRGVLVLAATRLVRHANWGLVTKIDRDEALAPFRSRMWRDGLTNGGLLLALVGLALLFWRVEHRSSAEALRALSSRQQALLAAIPDIVMEVDADKAYRWANPAGLEFFGKDVIGREAAHYFEGEQGTYETVRPLFRGEESVIYVESWQRRKDGAKRLLAWWCQVLKDGAGRVTGAISSGRDITERKRAETALRESEERFRSLYENTSIGLYRTTPDGRILMANPTALRLLGFASFEDLAQRNLETAGFEPAYARRDFRERLERDGKIVGLESVWNRRDGTVICVRESATVVRDENGQALHYDGTFEDITERRHAEQALRESEARYRLLVDQAPYAIGVQQEGRVIFANPATVRLFGATSAEDLIGKTIATLVHPEDWPATQDRVARMLAGEGGLFPTENRYLRLDGREVPVEVFASPFTHAGRPAVQVIAIDTTQRKRLEEELRQSQKMEAIGRLAGGVAHDFNNLLSVIFGYGSLLAQELPADGPARKKMDEILRASEQAAGLTRQLLAFSRRQAVQPVRLDVNTVLIDVEKMLRRLIGEDVELITNCAPDLWPVFADAGQIVQVFMNLAVNARDAMPTGGKLSIETRNVDLAPSSGAERRGPHVALIVSDTGEGMDRETLSRLFEPFFTTKTVGKGTGLGLATVHGIVQQNNGHVEVQSEPGRGSTFRVYLPRMQEPVAAPAAERRAHVWEPELRGSETILLVEDEEGLGVVISELLGTAGYKVVHAKDPVEALAHVRQQRPAFDVLLTDVIMPQMNGRDLALKVRAIQPEIKVIFMSGYAEDVLGTVLAADVAFLQKPFTQTALLRKLREALAGPNPLP